MATGINMRLGIHSAQNGDMDPDTANVDVIDWNSM